MRYVRAMISRSRDRLRLSSGAFSKKSKRSCEEQLSFWDPSGAITRRPVPESRLGSAGVRVPVRSDLCSFSSPSMRCGGLRSCGNAASCQRPTIQSSCLANVRTGGCFCREMIPPPHQPRRKSHLRFGDEGFSRERSLPEPALSRFRGRPFEGLRARVMADSRTYRGSASI
jgi:hypothetical protein